MLGFIFGAQNAIQLVGEWSWLDVYFGPANGRLCPVRALLSYAAGRGDRPGPFFIHLNATPLTKTHFVGAVRLALRQAGLEPRDYAGHSFRIGAATTAAMAGLEDSLIQSLGRWSSAAFLGYIRMPPAQLSTISATLARTSAPAHIAGS